MVRRRLSVPLLVLLLLALPSAADAAVPTLVAPADDATVESTAVRFLARGDAGLVLSVSRTPATVDACGTIAADAARELGTSDAADPTLQSFAVTGGLADGVYFWQVGVPDACEPSPVRRLVVVAGAPGGDPADPGDPALPGTPAGPEAPGLSTELIPRAIGATNRTAFAIAVGEGSPRVSRSRFLTLVRNSARRWRLSSRGTVIRVPRAGDGRADIGFRADYVPAGALGVTITLKRTKYRVRRVCGGSGCRTFRTRLGSRVVDRDLVLRPELPWAPGPAHPTAAQFDLETVLLHEFGHFAGNAGHSPVGCFNTPMVEALDTGEWWRSTGDFSYGSCRTAASRRRAATARAAAVDGPRSLLIVHHTIEQAVVVR